MAEIRKMVKNGNVGGWQKVWSKRCADETILQSGDTESVLMELARANGFDAIKDQIGYTSFQKRGHEFLNKLSARLPEGAFVQSIYEVGCGCGTNLFLFENDGISCGGLDYSSGLVESAKRVLHTKDISCAEAIDVSEKPQYDAVLSSGVFVYFPDEAYGEAVLEKMCRKAIYSIGIADILDAEKQEDFFAYRRATIPNFDERYQGLPKLFYTKEFFEDFARKHHLGIDICPVTMKGYWNSPFMFNCYLYHENY